MINPNKKIQFIGLVILLVFCILSLNVFGADHVVDNSSNIPCVYWTRGCSPTSATMVLGYWDRGDAGYEWFGMGKLTDYWREYSKYSDGTGVTRNVPNVLEELRIDMGTNVAGVTSTSNIDNGIESTCNTRNGYSFNSDNTTCSGAIWPFGNDWCWDKIREEIDNNRPFVWSVGIDNQVGHSLAAWGYTDAKYVITYNTWNCPGRDDWYYKKYDNGTDIDWGYVTTVVPGGWTWGQTSLTNPDGGETWTVGKTYNITWHEFDDRTWSADLYYSTNGGVNWTAFAVVEPSSPGWKGYAWTIPTSVSATNKARIRIDNWSGSSGSWVYQAGDGSEANFSIVRDLTAPTPNPMTWSSIPYEVSTSEIRMYATTASDPFGGIQYYFDYYSSPTGGAGGTDSGWQSSTYYSDTGLWPNHQYGYRVMARDGSPDHNQTAYSTVSYDYTDIETPTGILFSATVGANYIYARSTNTPSGLTRGSSGLIIYNLTAGTNSGWKQNNSWWQSSGLSPNTNYGFRAQARNGDANVTAYSGTYYKRTLAAIPSAAAFSNVTQTSIRANWTANGNPAGTQYMCENLTTGANSGWTTATYWYSSGLACNTAYSFRVKARNGDGVETAYRSLGSRSTLACAYDPPVIDGIGYTACISECPTCPDSHIVVTAHDPASGSLSYAWTPLNGGTVSPTTGAVVNFDPPDSGPHQCPYNVQVQVTSSVSGLTTTETVPIRVKLKGDVDANGVVNIIDKVAVRNAFGSSGAPGWIPADVDCSGVVNILDKVAVRNQFGQSGCGCP